MLKLVIGNRTYSSWSLRGWLACKQSGLVFQTVVIPLYGNDHGAAWDTIKHTLPDLIPSAGRVPVLWDGSAVVWDSLAILDHLVEHVGVARFWPDDGAARAHARSIVAEMHSGFGTLRSRLPFNLRRVGASVAIDDALRADLDRIFALWIDARARFGGSGPFLLGDFGAADIAYAPVVLRLLSYGVAVPGELGDYVSAVAGHEWIEQWRADAASESWRIPHFDNPEGLENA